jgi:hypothetical protein
MFGVFARLSVVTVTAAALATISGGPAHAEGTPVGISLAPGSTGLSLSQPSVEVTLAGTGTPGSTLSGALGETTVTDNRGTVLGWTVTAITSGHLVSTSDPSNAISLGATPVGGPLTVDVPSLATVGSSLLDGVLPGGGGSLNPTTPVVLATALAGTGSGSYSYNPELSFRVPANIRAETYRTVVIQTVA